MKIGLATTLVLIFLVLKLCRVIDWAWGWVFCPLWASAVLWILVVSLSVWGREPDVPAAETAQRPQKVGGVR